MSFDTTKAIDYMKGELDAKVEQIQPRLRDKCILRPFTGEFFTWDGIDGIEAVEVDSDTGDTQFQNIETNRRRGSSKLISAAVLIGKKNASEVFWNSSDEYASQILAAMGRKVDRIITAAAFSDVLTGKEFGTTKTFANDGGQTVDATGGLTFEKLLDIKAAFTKNDITTEDGAKITLILTENEHTMLMKETELTSQDFVGQYSIESGMMTNALGMDIVQFGSGARVPALDVTGGVRSCIAMATKGIAYGLKEDIEVTIDRRPDKNNAYQILAQMQTGALRTQGARMVKFTTTA